MVEEGYKCPVCLKDADAYGDHQVGCGGNGDRIHRHDYPGRTLLGCPDRSARAPERGSFIDPWILQSSSRPLPAHLEAGPPSCSRCYCNYAAAHCCWGCIHSGPRWGRRGKGLPTARIVYPLVSPSSLLWLSPWVGGVRRLPSPSRPLVVYKVRGRATHQQTQLPTYSRDFPSVYGDETPPCGSAEPLLDPRRWMESFDFFLFSFFIFQTVLYFDIG